MGDTMKKYTRPKADLVGKTFNEFTVLAEAPRHIRANGQRVRIWKCRCSCGNIRYLNKRELESGKRKSCGCKHDEYLSKSNTEHGDSHLRLHNIWSGMRARCYCETDYHFKWYGGRGIKMADEWRDNYASFKEWALSSGYEPCLSIDRVDNNGDYTPENCRWVTQKEQSNNTRRNHYISAFGETLTLTQWAEKTSIAAPTIRRRLKSGWTPEEALTKPIRLDSRHNKNKEGIP